MADDNADGDFKKVVFMNQQAVSAKKPGKKTYREVQSLAFQTTWLVSSDIKLMKSWESGLRKLIKHPILYGVYTGPLEC